MKIEKGKRYVRRDEVVTDPLTLDEKDWDGYPFHDPKSNFDYTINGKYWLDGPDNRYDLVSEYLPDDQVNTPRK